jgi:hypothetical protein
MDGAVNRFGTKWPYKFMDDPFFGTKRPRIGGNAGFTSADLCSPSAVNYSSNAIYRRGAQRTAEIRRGETKAPSRRLNLARRFCLGYS